MTSQSGCGSRHESKQLRLCKCCSLEVSCRSRSQAGQTREALCLPADTALTLLLLSRR